MKTLTPKKRQIKQREAKILDVARLMVVKEGYAGLNMDRIAEEIGVSKGTIYNHFACKEEIVIALAIKNVSKRTELFEKAFRYEGCPRHRLLAIAYAAEKFAVDYSDFFLLEQILCLSSVREKTSDKRQMIISDCEIQCVIMIGGVVRDAIESGDLVLTDGVTPEDIVFGLWALTSGAYSIIVTSQTLSHLVSNDPYETVRCHLAKLLDGYEWKPLSRDFDRNELLEDIRTKIFPDQPE